MKKEEIWQHYAMDTKRVRNVFKKNEHFKIKEIMDDLFDDSEIEDKKCRRKFPRVGINFQVNF